ncbi:MAG: hypothetical protein J6K17_05840 [Oscillospiraceae bacterium]|nr:hypothetical protein [Oscillospiraceae bacterium]
MSEVVFVNAKIVPVEDKLFQDAITSPLLAVRVTAQFVILFVPDLPIIVPEQVALPEEKLNVIFVLFVSV